MRVQLVGHVLTPPSFSSPVAISVSLLPSIFACRWCRVALPHGLFVPATLVPCAGRVSTSAQSHLYRHIFFTSSFSLTFSLAFSLAFSLVFSLAFSLALFNCSTLRLFNAVTYALFHVLILVHLNKVSPVCVLHVIM